MLHSGHGRSFSSTTTTENSPESGSERSIRRLRLTLHAGDEANREPRSAYSNADNKDGWKTRNRLIQRERPAGRESPTQPLGDMTNGLSEPSLQHHGPKMYGVVQRNNSSTVPEVRAREWTVNHLHDEMKYIREVRDSLEKVRERMYGQFGGMQHSVQKLSQEMRVANSRRRNLESEVKIRTAAMEKFDQMNSSLLSANIGLQKSLLDNCQTKLDTRDEMKNLRSTCEKTEEELRAKERELAVAHAENQHLRLQVESSREANSKALMELSMRLKGDYEEQLLEEQRKHKKEIEILQAQLDEYIRRLEEAELNIKIAEAKIAERDERISELERLLDCMGTEKSQLQQKLQECERRLRLLDLSDTTDGAAAMRSKDLQRESGNLRERIKHLNDMVFCQQRKVKGMIEEVQTLRTQVAQKDMFISELLDRIAMVECENNELEDKLKYFMSTQNSEQEDVDTGEIRLVYNILPRVDEVPWHDDELPILHEERVLSPIEHSPSDPPPFAIPPPPQMSPPLATYPPFSPTQPPLPPLPLSTSPPSSPTQTTPYIYPPFSPTRSPLRPLPSSSSPPSSPTQTTPYIYPPFSPTQPPLPPLPLSTSPPSSPTQTTPYISRPFSPTQPPLRPLPLSSSPPLSPTQTTPYIYPPFSPTQPPLPPLPLSPSPPSSPTQTTPHIYPPFSPTETTPNIDPPLSPTQPPLPLLPLSPSPPSSPTQTQPYIYSPSSPTQTTPQVDQPSSPTEASVRQQYPSPYLTMHKQPRTFKPNKPPASRLGSSLLRYTPVEYSRYLEANPTPPSETVYSSSISFESQTSESWTGDEVDTQTPSNPDQSSTSSRRTGPRIHCMDTPFTKLMEITANINIEVRFMENAALSRLAAMSSPRTGEQGQVGPLNNHSREQLQELLLRQNAILSNKRLIETLPDKGKKLRDFAEKINHAIEQHDEEERKKSLVSAARAEFQSKYQHAFTVRRSELATPQLTEGSLVCVPAEEEDDTASELLRKEAAAETMEMTASEASLISVRTKEADLAEALDRVTISTSTGLNGKNEEKKDNYFFRKPTQIPHIVTVLQRSENTSRPRQKFRPNQLPNRSDNSSSGSSSPSQSSEGSSPLSAQARRERDKKHLDDITAAKLPPLHHSPAQLLSLQESADLLRAQAMKQQDLQAKMAAQKLSEGLKISMGSYIPDSSSVAAYREVHDEGAQLSSEED
ncbi:protein GRINL1A [Nerophis ophidion]|uniref:protein GRINL1A n=1 Tax=Nerophis ophidion TaxID=159077 RepID=UPI002AE05B26|nr:protein GRINL1A [Nerophis ophidion]